MDDEGVHVGGGQDQAQAGANNKVRARRGVAEVSCCGGRRGVRVFTLRTRRFVPRVTMTVLRGLDV